MKYATGKYAYGICARCGCRAAYTDLVSDGQIPGMRVHPGCRDEKHPSERPFRADDSIALRNPSPEIFTSSQDPDGSLIGSLEGNSFGGGT